NGVYSARSRRDSTTVCGSPASRRTACTSCAARPPSCDQSSSAAALSEWVIARSTGAGTPARRTATANGTLIVDQATPDVHVPNDWVPPSADATAIPTVPGKLSKDTLSPWDREHRVVAVQTLGRQLPLEHLEGRRLGQVRADSDIRRPLLGPEVVLLGQERAKLVRVELGAGGQHQRGHHLIADGGVWHRIHGHLGYARMAGQYPFDRCGAEVFAVDP